MNWKNILNENLLILGFDFDSLSAKKSERMNLFTNQNREDFQTIIMFLISKQDTVKYEELSKLALLKSDRKRNIEFLKEIHSWCSDIISKTFRDFTFSTSIFVSPNGQKIYEILGKLTSSFMRLKLASNSSLRNRVDLSQWEKSKISPSVILNCLENDFIRETKIYLEYLNMLVERKTVFQNKIQTLQVQITTNKRVLYAINNKIAINNVNFNLMDEKTLDFIKEELLKLVEESNLRNDELMRKIDNFHNLCEKVTEIYRQRPPLVHIELPQLNNMESKQFSDLFLDDGKLSVERVIRKIAEELSFNRGTPRQPFSTKEIDRVVGGIERISTVFKGQLELCGRIKEDFIRMKQSIDDRPNKSEFPDLKEYGPIPSVDLMLRLCENGWQVGNETGDDEHGIHVEMVNEFSNGNSNDYSNSDQNSLLDNSHSMYTTSHNTSFISLESIENNIEVAIDPKYLIRTPNKRYLLNKEENLFSSTNYISHEMFNDLTDEDESEKSISGNVEEYPNSDDKRHNESHNSDGNFFDKSNDSFLENIYQEL